MKLMIVSNSELIQVAKSTVLLFESSKISGIEYKNMTRLAPGSGRIQRA